MLPIAALLDVGGKLIDKLIPDPEAKAKANFELAKMAQDGELAKMANDTEIYKTEQENVTERWRSDMGSDSWLSKNIRPLALIAIFPGFQALTRAANPALAEAQASSPIVVMADPATCALQFDPIGKTAFASSCDIAKSVL